MRADKSDSVKRQSRPGGAWETSRTRGLFRRLTLRRSDGRVYLDRWGVGHDRVGRILVHRMEAPDPGVDLHDHPWWFASLVVWGGYTEQRINVRDAAAWAESAEVTRSPIRGLPEQRHPGSFRAMRLDECHRITDLHRRTCWTLVIGGPRRRRWGFYLPGGWMPEAQYDATVRSERRDLWSDQNAARPW